MYGKNYGELPETLCGLQFKIRLCSRKPEAADREISRDMARLRADITKYRASKPAVVLLSSDKDFIADVKELQHAGHPVFVVHKAAPEPDHDALLRLWPTAGASLNEILARYPSPAPPGAYPKPAALLAGASAAAAQRPGQPTPTLPPPLTTMPPPPCIVGAHPLQDPPPCPQPPQRPVGAPVEVRRALDALVTFLITFPDGSAPWTGAAQSLNSHGFPTKKVRQSARDIGVATNVLRVVNAGDVCCVQLQSRKSACTTKSCCAVKQPRGSLSARSWRRVAAAPHASE